MMWKATVTPITTSYNGSMQKSISKHTTLPLKVSTAQRERAALVEVCAPSRCIWFYTCSISFTV